MKQKPKITESRTKKEKNKREEEMEGKDRRKNT